MVLELGLQISEKEYRALPYPSYSLLSSLSKNGPQAVYGEKIDISDADAIVIGSIVDAIVTEGGPPANMVIVDKKPSNKALEIIKALAARDDLADPMLLSVKNQVMIKEECDKVEYYKSSNTAARIKHLKNYQKYAKAVQKHGDDAMIVSSYQFHEASELAKNIFARFPFLKGDNIIGQVKIMGEINDVELKGMLDFIHIDHEKKEITPFDLKTGRGAHYEFFEGGFLNWNYYIQASVYREILQQYIKTTELADYKIKNFRFLFCGRKDRLPIIYRVTDKWHEAGFKGFTYEGKYYPGVNELIEDLIYYLEHPNALYRKGFDKSEIDFDDSLLTE